MCIIPSQLLRDIWWKVFFFYINLDAMTYSMKDNNYLSWKTKTIT